MKASPLAVLAGRRTPFTKAYGKLNDCHAVDLGVASLRASLDELGLAPDAIDEVIFGNVSGPADAANIARVISMKAGVPADRIAHTVNRNCASGMESIISGWNILREGRARTVIAGGTESMSNIPLLVNREAARLVQQLSRARTLAARIKILSRLRPRHFRPEPAVLAGLTDPVCGLNMGQTAERLATEFAISRSDQDQFALDSHLKAAKAQERCFLSGEIAPVADVDRDDGVRPQQTLAALQKLKPIFDSTGSVTAGNSCPLTDGAATVALCLPEAVDARSTTPLGYVTAYAIAGCDPARMGLGPVYATVSLLQRTGLSLSNFDLFEINEAFAAQVLACIAAFESKQFAETEFGLNKPIGRIPMDRLNVHGGAIALGHPVGTTGTRMIITLLRSLRERGLQRGLATLCVGGGQGVAMVVQTQL